MCSRMSLFFIFSLAIPQCQPALKGRYKEGTGGQVVSRHIFACYSTMLTGPVGPGQRGGEAAAGLETKKGGEPIGSPPWVATKKGGERFAPPPCSPLGAASLPDVGACLDLVDQIGFDLPKPLG